MICIGFPLWTSQNTSFVNVPSADLPKNKVTSQKVRKYTQLYEAERPKHEFHSILRTRTILGQILHFGAVFTSKWAHLTAKRGVGVEICLGLLGTIVNYDNSLNDNLGTTWNALADGTNPYFIWQTSPEWAAPPPRFQTFADYGFCGALPHPICGAVCYLVIITRPCLLSYTAGPITVV